MSITPPKKPAKPEFPSMKGLAPDDPNGIRARRRALCMKAEEGDENAIKELFEIAFRLSAEIDIDTEMSLDRILLASLITPIKNLLVDEKARLASFGVHRDPNRPRSNRTERRHIRIAENIGSNLAVGDNVTQAILKAADAHYVTERTAQRVYKELRHIVDVVKIVEERKTRKLREE